jgi:hypothetical protein
LPRRLNMNVQQHARIAQIKMLSGYMYTVLRWVANLSLLIWFFLVLKYQFPLAIIASKIFTGFSFNIYSYPFYVVGVFALVFGTLNAYFILKVIRHLRDVMKSFQQGEIFNGATISHACCAVKNALLVWGIELFYRLGFSLVLDFYTPIAQSSDVSSVSSDQIQTLHISENIGLYLKAVIDVFYGLMFFSLMYLFLWALEIGRDLNEESELTI